MVPGLILNTDYYYGLLHILILSLWVYIYLQKYASSKLHLDLYG